MILCMYLWVRNVTTATSRTIYAHLAAPLWSHRISHYMGDRALTAWHKAQKAHKLGVLFSEWGAWRSIITQQDPF